MQKNILTLLSFALFLCLYGCSDELKEKAKLNVSATAKNSVMEGDTLVIHKSDSVVFHLSGNPDFILFFSGEPGREYRKRNQTEIPIEEISSKLNFTAFAQYGTVPNSMKVYLSAEFEGLLGKGNKKADSLRVEQHNWIDITEQCKLPTASNGTSNVDILVDEYLGKRLTIAFLYDPQQNVATQPTWEMRNLKIINTEKKTGLKSELPATSMGFSPFDVYAIGDAAYASGTAAGVWGLTSARLRIASSGAGLPVNKDWMISAPFTINSRTVDKSIGIKTMTNNKLETYTYVYNQVGSYVVTFVARNTNFEHSSETVKELVIKVIE